jgi:hypothetical protein
MMSESHITVSVIPGSQQTVPLCNFNSSRKALTIAPIYSVSGGAVSLASPGFCQASGWNFHESQNGDLTHQQWYAYFWNELTKIEVFLCTSQQLSPKTTGNPAIPFGFFAGNFDPGSTGNAYVLFTVWESISEQVVTQSCTSTVNQITGKIEDSCSKKKRRLPILYSSVAQMLDRAAMKEIAKENERPEQINIGIAI